MIFSSIATNPGVLGVSFCSTWAVIAEMDSSVLPPGKEWTISGLMAIAIIYLVRENRDKNKKIIDMLQGFLERDEERPQQSRKNKRSPWRPPRDRY